MKRVLSLLLILYMVFISIPLYADADIDINNLQKKINIQNIELNNIDKEISQYKKKVDLLENKKKNIGKKLNKIEKEIKYGEKEIRLLNKDLLAVKNNIKDIEKSLVVNIGFSKKYKEMMKAALLNYYYKEYRRRYTNSLWTTLLFDDDINKNAFEKAVIIMPGDEYIDVQDEIMRIKSLRKDLEREKKSLLKIQKDMMNVQNSFIRQKRKQLSVFKKTEAKRKKRSSQIDEMKNRKKRLKELIKSFKKEVKNKEMAKDFIKSKGMMPWPVHGQIISKFGKQQHAELDAIVINRGISIKVYKKRGRKVTAIARGEIVYSDIFEGLINMVVIDHGNGYYTIYGNLGEMYVKVGQYVNILEDLGKLDKDTLYFELGQGTTPIDPQEWLKNIN